MTDRERIIDGMSLVELVKFLDLGGEVPRRCAKAMTILFAAKLIVVAGRDDWRRNREAQMRFVRERQREAWKCVA